MPAFQLYYPNTGGGTTWYSGTTIPDPSLGMVGSYYIFNNGVTFRIYGPKTMSGWGSGIELQIANGFFLIAGDEFDLVSGDSFSLI
jgi:hypothetical protein